LTDVGVSECAEKCTKIKISKKLARYYTTIINGSG